MRWASGSTVHYGKPFSGVLSVLKKSLQLFLCALNHCLNCMINKRKKHVVYFKMLLLSFLEETNISFSFQKDMDDFEIGHQTCLFLIGF